jgi:energy-coupling factor transporter ATP-binding protein EcfA2
MTESVLPPVPVLSEAAGDDALARLDKFYSAVTGNVRPEGNKGFKKGHPKLCDELKKLGAREVARFLEGERDCATLVFVGPAMNESSNFSGLTFKLSAAGRTSGSAVFTIDFTLTRLQEDAQLVFSLVSRRKTPRPDEKTVVIAGRAFTLRPDAIELILNGESSAELGDPVRVALSRPTGVNDWALGQVKSAFNKEKSCLRVVPFFSEPFDNDLPLTALTNCFSGREAQAPTEFAKLLVDFVTWSFLVDVLDDACSSQTAPNVGDGENAVLNAFAAVKTVATGWNPLKTRNVELTVPNLKKALGARLVFPDHLLQAVCAALNAGKHLILCGPPGCGKTELAKLLPEVAKLESIIVTASPSWSSGEVIGRYVPEPQQGGMSLRFEPGHFLRAVAENKWLIIDEFNRANIDESFGELFSVLSGAPTELPFRVEVPSGSESGAPQRKQVRLSPSNASTTESDNFFDYKMSSDLRIIGTMNDSDRATLNKLSFALLRRFHVIRVDAPPPDAVKEFIGQRIQKAIKTTERPSAVSTLAQDVVCNALRDTCSAIFVGRERLVGLIASHFVGMSSIGEVLSIVQEGLFETPPPALNLTDSINLARSWLAVGLALAVLPQLDALDEPQFRHAVNLLLEPLRGTPFVQLRDGKVTPLDIGIDFDEDSTRTSAAEYIAYEIVRHNRGTERASFVEGCWPGRSTVSA